VIDVRFCSYFFFHPLSLTLRRRLHSRPKTCQCLFKEQVQSESLEPPYTSLSSSISQKKNKEDPDTVTDSFYWPSLPRSELHYSFSSGKKNKPILASAPKASVFQIYVVPSSFSGYMIPSSSQSQQLSPFSRSYNDCDAMYSMWVPHYLCQPP
jgi:hypothetical protein